jgi:hypothetical protein
MTTCNGQGGAAPYCSMLDTVMDCGGCGVACKVNQTCVAGSCTPCTPMVSSAVNTPMPPAGLKVDCLVTPCPVVVCGLFTFYIFSYDDNRSSFAVTGYDVAGNLVRGPTEEVGARYIMSIALDAAAMTATLAGQSTTVVVPWSLFQ